MPLRKIPITDGFPDNQEDIQKPIETNLTVTNTDEVETESPAAKPPIRGRGPAKPKVTATAATTGAATKTPARRGPKPRVTTAATDTPTKTPARRGRKPAALKTEPEIPTIDNVKEITAINDENADAIMLANQEKPMKDDDKKKKKKKKKAKAKAKKEKAKKKAQKKKEKKKKEKKKAKAKKKKDKKKKNKKKK